MPPKYVSYKKLLQSNFIGFEKFGNVPLRVELFFGVKPSKGATYNKYSTPYMDADNCAKGVLDAMNGILYPDDVMIEELMITKKYATSDCIFITIKEIECGN